jgi:predicted nucleic acid-binding protein
VGGRSRGTATNKATLTRVMVIADTSVWVDFLRGRDASYCDHLASLLEEQDIALCDRVLQEVLQGVRDDAMYRRVSATLRELPCFDLGGAALAINAAQNFRRLRRIGVTPRRATGVLIATFCIEQKHTLLHNDRDFDPMVKHLGLQVAAQRA